MTVDGRLTWGVVYVLLALGGCIGANADPCRERRWGSTEPGGSLYIDEDCDGEPDIVGNFFGSRPDAAPTAINEVPNGQDDDGDGEIDEDVVIVGLVCDDDGDGYSGCLGRADCDDGDANVHPGAHDANNHQDDDCDGRIDED